MYSTLIILGCQFSWELRDIFFWIINVIKLSWKIIKVVPSSFCFSPLAEYFAHQIHPSSLVFFTAQPSQPGQFCSWNCGHNNQVQEKYTLCWTSKGYYCLKGIFINRVVKKIVEAKCLKNYRFTIISMNLSVFFSSSLSTIVLRISRVACVFDLFVFRGVKYQARATKG